MSSRRVRRQTAILILQWLDVNDDAVVAEDYAEGLKPSDSRTPRSYLIKLVIKQRRYVKARK